MGFAPLEEIEGPIVLTLRGKEYTLPVVMWEDGVKLQHLIAEHAPYIEVLRVLLGPVLEDLANDGASAALINRVADVAVAEWRFGREAAEKAWMDPKAVGEMIGSLTQAILAQIPPTTPEAEDTTTSPPAPGTGTKTPKTAARSRGRKSSPTGASS